MRVHGLIDLQAIDSLEDIDLAKTRTTDKRLFAYRKKHDWPPTIEIMESWRESYAEQAESLGVLPNINSNTVHIKRTLESIGPMDYRRSLCPAA